MTEHPDAVELLTAELKKRYVTPSSPLFSGEIGAFNGLTLAELLAALLQDSGEAGVRLWKEKCEGCGGLGAFAGGLGDSCPTCSGQGYVVRVAVLELSDHVEVDSKALILEVVDGTPPDFVPLYRDRPINVPGGS